MPDAIVIGATSGIGRALAVELAENGYNVGITGRRTDRLDQLGEQIPTMSYAMTMDVRHGRDATPVLEQLIEKMNGVDLIIINSGVLFRNATWAETEAMIETNITGFVAMAEMAMKHFIDRGHGHLVGISSIASVRGAKGSPVYNASKAFVSNYLDGLRHRVVFNKLPVHITDIRPGFVRTAMIEDRPGVFWAATPEKAARQICDAIVKKKKRVYITKRWRLIAWLAGVVPDWIYHKW